ncbi:hypothetical protein Dsin_032562 [Dipteronia sinensis]|uniref:NADPH--cytochrome P450 reductase n=1 Tax=Dipteronia sinensis TaxID=43782 RepID=A0AAD9Z999_9ROSI|nr:hypothetical protein Dsin_032562 [Dipteronia sinensis]
MVQLNLRTIHHDRDAFGEDADQFRPERMLHMDNIPEGAWRPFGVGMRSCIGRAFAEQEMIINVALILQRFQVEMVDPSYKLEFLVTMTIKPKDFKIKVRRRPGRGMDVGLYATKAADSKDNHMVNGGPTDKSLLILYGSNAGTCQAYAEELASEAGQYGYHADVKTMDSMVERLPKDRPIAIITPSYEGKPADNAKKFVAWLMSNRNSGMLHGIKYFVFGVGNKEWSQTYHKVPKQVDMLLEAMGGERIIETGFVDVESDTTGPFEDWRDKVWATLSNSKPTASKTLQAKITKGTTTQTLAGFSNPPGIVKKNITIADESVGPSKMHMEIELPESVSYQTGDYIAVLPFNHRDDVRRVIARFKLNSDDAIHIAETRKEFLKTDAPISVHDLIASRVELTTPITQRQLKSLAERTKDEKEKENILKMSGDEWETTLKRRFSVIDVLEDHPSCELEFADYLDMLKPITARQYSISSSMIDHQADLHQARATITYDVHDTEAWCGNGRAFHDVASSYLADLKPGNEVRCTVRQTNSGFHLPKDPMTPIIMICSGTGLAPMRGFIEERAAIQKARGQKLGPALLYYGCRDMEKDYLYKGQLEEWEKQGVVSLRPCFSKHGTEQDQFKYTSDRIYAEKEECGKLFGDGAKIFICGSASKIARSTAEMCMKIHMEHFPDCTREEAEKWLDGIKEDRYVSDVFG